MKRRIKIVILIITLLLGGAGSGGCVRKLDGETSEQFKARKKAVHSAQLVTGLAGLTDLTEILVASSVLDRADGFKLVEINDRALAAVDILRERLKTGFDAGAIAKVRNVIADIEKARQAGLLTFSSLKAQEFFFDAIAGLEITLNLIESALAGKREAGVRVAADRAMQRLQLGADEPRWWNRAIVKATEIARTMVAQGNLDTEAAWLDGAERSAKLHAKNRALIEAWK